MSVARNIIKFQDATGLSPTKLNKAWNRLALDVKDVLDQRYFYSTVKLDYSGVKDTSIAEEFVFRVKPPFRWEVVGVELISYGVANVTGISLASSLTNWKIVSLTTATGTKVLSTANFVATGAASTEITFTLTVTSTGAYTIGRTYVNLLIRADRGSGSYSTYGIGSPPQVASGDSVSASVQNTGFTNYETAVTASTNANSQLSFLVFPRRNIGTGTIPASDADIRIPSSSRVLHSIDVLTLAPVGKSFTATVLDEVAATVVTVTVNGNNPTTAKTQGTTCGPDTQSTNAPTTAASDYKLRLSNTGGGAANPLSYAVLYFTV